MLSHGRVFFVECDKERSRDGDCDGLKGSRVIINNKEYKVKGIECHMLATPISKGELIGLLV
jgi:hypothetical protein